MSRMKLVVIESPLSGDQERNLGYAKACIRDSLARGEAPYASHVMFAQRGLLDDTVPAERELGMEAGFAWGEKADKVAVYVDHGISPGMQEGIERHKRNGLPIVFRKLVDRE